MAACFFPMKLTDYDVEIVDWKTYAAELKAIRRVVFVEEQNVPVELEWDGLDQNCTHFIVRSSSKAIATARLKPDGQIGRMAVLQAYRGIGAGSKLMTSVYHMPQRLALLGFIYMHRFRLSSFIKDLASLQKVKISWMQAYHIEQCTKNSDKKSWLKEI